MSSIVLGAAQFGLDYGINNKAGRPGEDQILRLLELAWSNGIREIDTAQDYGNSEEVLGACFKKLPFNFIVHSKFCDSGISIQEAINVSLKKLGIENLGFFYFHKFSEYVTYRSHNPNGEVLVKCKGLAVSVYDEVEMRIALKDSFIKAIQLPLNIFDCSEDKLNLIKEAQEKGKSIYVRSVFLQGLILMSPESLPEKLKLFHNPLMRIEEICYENNLSKRDLALGFVKSISKIDGLLIGVDTIEQLQENILSLESKVSSQLINELREITISDKSMLLPKNWN